MSGCKKSYSTLSLLPQTPGSLLKGRKQKVNVLNLMIKLIRLSIDAIEAFISRKLPMFDAQVGENLCQIRAYKLISLTLDNVFITTQLNPLIEKLKLLQISLEEFNEYVIKSMNACSGHNQVLDKKESVFSFFNNHNIITGLTEDVLFVITSFFLSEFCTRENDIPIAIKHSKIIEELNIAKYSAKRIVHYYQTLLADLSCKFIFKITDETGDKLYSKAILMKLKQLSDENRYVLPCHEVTTIILLHILKRRFYIIFIVYMKNKKSNKYKQVAFLFQGNDDKKRFALVNPNDTLPANFPILLIRGVSEYSIKHKANIVDFTQSFLEKGVFAILLGNTAMHPQYSGSRLYALRDNPFNELLVSEKFPQNINMPEIRIIKELENQLLQHKKFALSEGCCKENPKIFFLKHIYCMTYEACKLKYLNLGNTIFANDIVETMLIQADLKEYA